MFANYLLWGIVLTIICMAPYTLPGQAPSPEELLSWSINYHDPDNTWEQARHQIHLIETRPNGSDRKTSLTLHLPTNYFESTRLVDGYTIQQTVASDEVSITVDGSNQLDSSIIKQYRLTPDRALFMRNYYTYLWGLPMKLHDPGTIIDDQIESEVFNGQDAWKMKVTYDPEVGHDIWYFYFDESSYALIGYRFYHDESANDGEYITLKGEAKIGSMLLPAERAWYMHEDDKYLGTDKIDVH